MVGILWIETIKDFKNWPYIWYIENRWCQVFQIRFLNFNFSQIGYCHGIYNHMGYLGPCWYILTDCNWKKRGLLNNLIQPMAKLLIFSEITLFYVVPSLTWPMLNFKLFGIAYFSRENKPFKLFFSGSRTAEWVQRPGGFVWYRGWKTTSLYADYDKCNVLI